MQACFQEWWCSEGEQESERSLKRMNNEWCTEELGAFVVTAPRARPMDLTAPWAWAGRKSAPGAVVSACSVRREGEAQFVSPYRASYCLCSREFPQNADGGGGSCLLPVALDESTPVGIQVICRFSKNEWLSALWVVYIDTRKKLLCTVLSWAGNTRAEFVKTRVRCWGYNNEWDRHRQSRFPGSPQSSYIYGYRIQYTMSQIYLNWVGVQMRKQLCPGNLSRQWKCISTVRYISKWAVKG